MDFKIKSIKGHANKSIFSQHETSVSVNIINGLFCRFGLLSDRAKFKVHWFANFSAFCFVASYIQQVITFFMTKNNPDLLFECFTVVVFFSMGLLKLISLRNCHVSWRFLLNQISKLEDEELNYLYTNLDYQSEDEDENNFSYYINNYTGKFKSIDIFLERVYSITGMLYIVAPFLGYLCWMALGKEHLAYPHILQGWIFFDNLGIYFYVVTVCCEFFGSLLAIASHIVFDVTAIGIMIFVCGQFSLLRNYCTRIGGNGRICILSKKRDNRARFRIRHCHRIHMLIIKSVHELDMLLKNIKGIYFFLSTFALCCIAVRVNLGDISTVQFVALFVNLCGTLTQLFLYCRYGDEVLNEVNHHLLTNIINAKSAVGMGEGPFAASYWCLSPHVRRELNILGICMMTRRHLRAGPFSYLDLPSFITVIRTAYSYYAVLAQNN